MIVAKKLREENLCEYLLYMWQVEDLIRAVNCDPQEIERLILSRYTVDEPIRGEILRWYLELADMMRQEGKRDSGHLDINRIVLMQLDELNRRLLSDAKEYVYAGLHYQILPAVVQLRGKGGESASAGDVETCLNAVYGFLTLKLKGEEIHADTQKSIEQISAFLSMLAHKWQEEKSKEKN